VYSSARKRAFAKTDITSVWAACGLFPLNLDRVPRKTLKPLPELIVQRAYDWLLKSILNSEYLSKGSIIKGYSSNFGNFSRKK
jgi:hypothetical protein